MLKLRTPKKSGNKTKIKNPFWSQFLNKLQGYQGEKSEFEKPQTNLSTQQKEQSNPLWKSRVKF